MSLEVLLQGIGSLNSIIVRSSPMASFDTVMKDQTTPEDNDAVEQADIDSTMRRILEKARSDVHAAETSKDTTEQRRSAPRRDFDTAFELLDCVSKTFDLVVTRFQRMQRELDVQAERAAVRAAEQEQAIEKWQQLALDLKNESRLPIQLWSTCVPSSKPLTKERTWLRSELRRCKQPGTRPPIRLSKRKHYQPSCMTKSLLSSGSGREPMPCWGR